MKINKGDAIDLLLTIQDALTYTWIVDSSASFHVPPIKELFHHFMQALMETFFSTIIMPIIGGIGIVHLTLHIAKSLHCMMSPHMYLHQEKTFIYQKARYAWI